MSARRYAATQVAVATPRETELRAFRFVNGLLAGANEDLRARTNALHKTHHLWAILLAGLLSPGNALPQDLRGNLVSLGLWAQKEAMARIGTDASLEPLMALHRDMIEALESQALAERPMPPPARLADRLATSA
ncbi:flagellar biosynthesis regulator FlaF [Humitalea sp. 24SJ18S-53]|uniref:flagellar biosynthesis regulator FlaF n=1 Tax=Humitalea sp. 24SJ18S-53 TaxID=3422307 RepID=UPI003D6680EB